MNPIHDDIKRLIIELNISAKFADENWIEYRSKGQDELAQYYEGQGVAYRKAMNKVFQYTRNIKNEQQQ